MDEDFFNQIDNLAELLPRAKEEKLDPEILICECFCVSVGDIRDCCRQLGFVDVNLLKGSLGLGEGCQKCVKSIDGWRSGIF